jgi:lipoic acid synthetase
MLGLGETMNEVKEVMGELREWGVEILTIGQYLQPSRQHLPIARYVHPDEFAELKEYGLGIGFRWVESGPLVRSSYHAAEQVRALSTVHRQLYGED